MGNKKWILFAVVMGVTFATFGEEAAKAVAEDQGPSGIRGWLIDIAIAIAAFGGTLISIVIGLGKSKTAKTEAQKEAWDALGAGVNGTYETLRLQLKEANKDHKITAEEAKELREHAIRLAKDVATGPALTVLKTTALPILHDWVQQIVNKRKAE